MTIYRITGKQLPKIQSEHTIIIVDYGHMATDQSRIKIESSLDQFFSLWALSEIRRTPTDDPLIINELYRGLSDVVAELRRDNSAAKLDFSYRPCFILDEISVGSLKKKLFVGMQIAIAAGGGYIKGVSENITANIAADRVETFLVETLHTQSKFAFHLEAACKNPDWRLGAEILNNLTALCQSMVHANASLSVGVKSPVGTSARIHISAEDAANALPPLQNAVRVSVERLKNDNPDNAGPEGDESNGMKFR